MIIKKYKDLKRFIFADEENFSLEERMVLSSIIIGILTCILGSIVNMVLSTSAIPIIVGGILVILLLVLYYFLRIKKIFKPLVIPIIIAALTGISVIWVTNGGLNGSNILPAYVILILSLVAVPDRAKKHVLFTFLFLTIAIYLIQFFRPDLITNFPTEKERWTDAFITLIYSTYFVFLIIKYLHKHYTIEREKVEKSEQKLIQLNADKDRFISILAHDLKGPFGSIIGLLEAMKEDIYNNEYENLKEHFDAVHESANNTSRLLEDILKWATAQSGKFPIKPDFINFSEINKSVIEVLNPIAASKEIKINNFINTDLMLFADFAMINTVHRNLLSNAIKFTNKEGLIEISAVHTTDSVIISVSDNGIGIQPEIADKLFNITEIQSAKGTQGESGTGLGLLLCKEFIEKHNGKIWIESNAEAGTIFKYELPAGKKD